MGAPGSGRRLQLGKSGLELPVAKGNLLLEMTKGLVGQLEAEQILGAVVAGEGLDDGRKSTEVRFN